MSQVEASEPTIKALLTEAARANYLPPIALGVQAPPRWTGTAMFRHDDRNVRVVPCVSALAARQALLERNEQDWLVIVTDRPATDLGDGILAHFAWQRLRNPDVWNAVLESFGARLFDPALEARGRALADGLLLMTPAAGGWPVAPAGMLTRDHALGSVAAVLFGHGERVATGLDLDRVLRWSTEAGTTNAVRAARANNGETLFGAVADWMAEQCGDVEPVVKTLLAGNRAADLVPLGLVVQVLSRSPSGSGPRALLDHQLGQFVSETALHAWSQASVRVARAALARRSNLDMPRVLARAEVLLTELQSVDLVESSEILPLSLHARLVAVGLALKSVAAGAVSRAVDDAVAAPLAAGSQLSEVEGAWARVLAHVLADRENDRSVAGAEAGVRLVRWLSGAGAHADSFGAALNRFRDADTWADRAVAEAWNATEISELRAGLNVVLAATRLRREAADMEFAQRLATAIASEQPPPAGAVHIEDVLAAVVADLPTPILLVVADGMSLANAAQIVDGLTVTSGWWECVPKTSGRRLLSIGALPTVTRICRTSLLCGHLTDGDQVTERTGLAAWGKAHHRTVELFHKLALDTSTPGSALADDVRAALDATDAVQIVACVVNTIDDALDRSDPGGTDWTADSVKHLRPLLDRARQAGRTVVLTSDHGHVIERRQGHVAAGKLNNSNRWRPVSSASATSEEVLVRGSRVIAGGNQVVLAVNDHLRYSTLKAGYHGGGSPAEVVVPVLVLSPGAAPPGWELAPPQAPAWWREPVTSEVEPSVATSRRDVRDDAVIDYVRGPDVLFDIQPAKDRSKIPAATDTDVATSFATSAIWGSRSRRATRRQVSDDNVVALVAALLAAIDHRIPEESAAAALGVAPVQLAGAFSQVQRLLNVEQYPVIIRGEGQILLDVELLQDQFELRT